MDCIEIEDRKEWDLSDVAVKEELFSFGSGLKETLLPRFETMFGSQKKELETNLMINEDI